MTSHVAFDLFLDLSGTDLDGAGIASHLRYVLRDGELETVVGTVTMALPTGLPPHDAPLGCVTRPTGAAAFRAAMEAAARFQRPLLVLTGLLVAPSAVVASLLAALASDPMIGTAQPRFAEAATDAVHPLPGAGGEAAAPISRRALIRLPDSVFTPELPAACLVLRHELSEAMSLPPGLDNAGGALALVLCQARRCGFRNLVLNRVLISTSLPPDALYPRPGTGDGGLLMATYPDSARAMAEMEALPQRRFETLLGEAWPLGRERRSLLVDCRGLGPIFNGTSVCMLGLLDGLAALDTPWRINVLCSAEAAGFHGLARRHPGFGLHHGLIEANYAAALMPNQPWSSATVAELHRHALVTVFNILDTIAWDVLYPLNDRVAPAWRLIARHADGLAFISEFSRDRFRARFPLSPGVAECVAHLTLDRDELTLPACRGLPTGSHVLLFGNDYDHKGLAPTLRILTEAFPLQRIVVLGGRTTPTPFVRPVPSGQADSEEVHRLIATAQAVIYPSFYEGFGLPVVESLAYGRPVLVRRSPIWPEIAGHARLPGRLLPFDGELSLVAALGRVLEGLPGEEIPIGAHLGAEQPVTAWRDCAARLLALLDRCIDGIEVKRWLHRNEVLEG